MKKNKSHTKFKMFLCMKNPNENILHVILSLKFFFFKCLLLYFTFSFHAAKISILYYQRNILELIKLIKLKKPVQTVFSLSIKILPTVWTTKAANILISLQNTCMSWQNHARCFIPFNNIYWVAVLQTGIKFPVFALGKFYTLR